MSIYQRIVLVLGGIILAAVLLEGASEGMKAVIRGIAVAALTFSAYIGLSRRK